MSSLLADGWRGEEMSTLLDRLDEPSLSLFRSAQVPAEDWPRWLALCASGASACTWHDSGIRIEELEDIAEHHGLKPSRLSTWLAAGHTPHGMIDAHRNGFKTPQAWANELQRSKLDGARQVWTASADEWLEAIDLEPAAAANLLDVLYEEGVEWAATTDDVLAVHAPQEWLEEQQDRPMNVTESLLRDPHWPVIFEADDLTIILDASGDYAVAWVGCDGVGGLVCFDTEQFDVYTAEDNPSWRYMAGSAIAWFIDCCIVLRTARKGTLLEPAQRSTRSATSERVAVRYRPRPIFAAYADDVRQGHGHSPRPHWVDGFVRTFHRGQTPTNQARSRAPARIRRRLQANQTWVSGFSRGECAHIEELRNHLTKYSALADALGFVDAYLDDAAA